MLLLETLDTQRPFYHKERRPNGRCRVDWSRSITRGLLNALVPFENGGGFSIDLADQIRWPFDATPPTWTANRGLDFATTAFVDRAAADADYLGPVTLFWFGAVDTGSAFRHYMGKHAGAGATANPFDFRTTNDPTPRTRLVVANTAVRDYQGQLITLGAREAHAVNRPALIETVPTEYLNGLPFAMSLQAGAGTGAPTGTGANIRVGRRADGGVQLDGRMEAVFIWKRLLSNDEHMALWLNPYHFLMPDDFTPFPYRDTSGDPVVVEGQGAAQILGTCGHPMMTECDPWLEVSDNIPVHRD